jgi:hypothetical protein
MKDSAWNAIATLVNQAAEEKDEAILAYQDAFDAWVSYGTHTTLQKNNALLRQTLAIERWHVVKRLLWIRNEGIPQVEAALAQVRKIIKDSERNNDHEHANKHRSPNLP